MGQSFLFLYNECSPTICGNSGEFLEAGVKIDRIILRDFNWCQKNRNDILNIERQMSEKW